MQTDKPFTFKSVDLTNYLSSAEIEKDIAESVTAACKTVSLRLSSLSTLSDKEMSELERLIQESFGVSHA